MTEQQIKELCKWTLDNGNRKLTEIEKEAIKQAIDQSNNIEELLVIAISLINK